MESALAYGGEQIVHLDKGTLAWVSLKQFRIERDLPDADLLDALIAHWAYHDHYAGGDVSEQSHHTMHGPYRLECITASSFRAPDAASARGSLQAWVEAMTVGRPSDPIQDELAADVYPRLDAPSLYELPDLRPEAEHDWG